MIHVHIYGYNALVDEAIAYAVKNVSGFLEVPETEIEIHTHKSDTKSILVQVPKTPEFEKKVNDNQRLNDITFEFIKVK